MSTYWTNFAGSGDPSDGQPVFGPAWPRYSLAADTIIRFDVNSSAPPPAGGPGTALQSGLRREACDFMEGRHTRGTRAHDRQEVAASGRG